MRYFISILIIIISSTICLAQKLNFYQDIQPIMLKNCVSCHRAGQIGPFELISYTDVSKRASFIETVTSSRYMPPWKADTEFRHFANERILSDVDIATIKQWVVAGKPEGKAKKGMDVATFMRDNFKNYKADLVIKMNNKFDIPADLTEQYRVFVLPTNTQEERYVQGVDFIAGNKSLAHHSRIMLDTTNLLRPDDGIAVGAPSVSDALGIKMSNLFWRGWVPGNTAIFYPEGIAKRLPAHSDLVLNMHYSPTPVAASDQSEIHIYYAKQKPTRLVETLILDEQWISNQPFEIAAGEVKTFYMRSPMLPVDLSLLSIMPHLHQRGKRFLAYAITPAGDLIPLLKIPDWDFNWQSTYQFQKLLKLPKGSVIYAEAEYDNTTRNAANPIQPPQKATYGWASNNEMLNLIIEYVPYQVGDENIGNE